MNQTHFVNRGYATKPRIRFTEGPRFDELLYDEVLGITILFSPAKVAVAMYRPVQCTVALRKH